MVKITIRLKANGATEYETEGFAGDSCFAFTSKLEELMNKQGVSVASKTVERTQESVVTHVARHEEVQH